MISKVIQVYPFESVDISQFKQKFCIDQSKIDYEIQCIKNKHAKWQEGEIVHLGDMVICAMESEVSKFNREKIQLVVGANMFHSELENHICNMKKGEKQIVSINEGSVTITVLKIQNKITPELTDEWIPQLDIEGVNTVKEYIDYLVHKQKQKLIEKTNYPAIQYVLQQVAQESIFSLKKQDWNFVIEQELNKFRELSKLEGLELEKMTEVDFEGKIPVKSYFELVSLVQNNAWESLINYVLGVYYADIEHYKLTEKDYEEFVTSYCEFWHNTIDQAKAITSLDYYFITEYSMYYYNKVRKYVDDHICIEEL